MECEEWDPLADPADSTSVEANSGHVDKERNRTAAEPPGDSDTEQQSGLPGLMYRRTAPPDTPSGVTPGPLRLLPPVFGRKIRMLCLHGNCSNSNITKLQMMKLRALAKDHLELLYVDGQLESVESDNLKFMKKLFPDERDFRDFFRYPDAALKNPKKMVDRTYECIDEALDHLRHRCAELAPVDGVWGFSQGANAANILVACALAAGKAPPSELSSLRFVVHACGARPGWTMQLPELYKEKLAMPALVIGGGPADKDADGKSRQWWCIGDLYESPQYLQHSDGHSPFPRSGEGKVEFANRILEFACAASGRSL